MVYTTLVLLFGIQGTGKSLAAKKLLLMKWPSTNKTRRY
jgi:SpoVK/Ycf46/Vps4 family AAA+-type ATPase